MKKIKRVKDTVIRAALGKLAVPPEFIGLQSYFRQYGSINFDFKKKKGLIIAVSTDFRYGSIVTYGSDEKELDENIKDAILTSFSVPSSYAKEAGIHRVGRAEEKYALA